MANCPPSDPCCCVQSVPSSPPSVSDCPSEGDCCLKACNSVLECTDAVGPCGQAGLFDLNSLEHIKTGCVDVKNALYSLEDHDGFFVDVQIKKNGELTWITGGPETVNKYGLICYKIQCQSDCDDCITLTSIGYIHVGVKDECRNVVCDEECEVCDPCTGTCIEEEVNVEIESDDENINCPNGDC